MTYSSHANLSQIIYKTGLGDDTNHRLLFCCFLESVDVNFCSVRGGSGNGVRTEGRFVPRRTDGGGTTASAAGSFVEAALTTDAAARRTERRGEEMGRGTTFPRFAFVIVVEGDDGMRRDAVRFLSRTAPPPRTGDIDMTSQSTA